MQLTDQVLLAYYRALPNAGTTALPGNADNRFGVLFGWGQGIVAILAVLGLFAAGVAFMHSRNGGNTEGPMKVGAALGAVIIADVAIAAVRLVQ